MAIEVTEQKKFETSKLNAKSLLLRHICVDIRWRFAWCLPLFDVNSSCCFTGIWTVPIPASLHTRSRTFGIEDEIASVIISQICRMFLIGLLNVQSLLDTISQGKIQWNQSGVEVSFTRIHFHLLVRSLCRYFSIVMEIAVVLMTGS